MNSLFLGEYKNLYYRKDKEDPELEEIFIEQQLLLSTMNLDASSYEADTNKKIIEVFLPFNISYDNFFKYYDKIEDEDKPEYKLKIAQSIIGVAFPKEKVNYTKEKYYEYYFIKKVIEKDMEETKLKFEDEYKTLFRKEDLCDDVIKYMFFIFGNSMLIESFVKPVKRMLKGIGIIYDNPRQDSRNNDAQKKRIDITVNEYNILLDEIYRGLMENIPHVLAILLKLLNNSIKKVFTIEEDNYNPLYTALIFNFIISPWIEMLYSLNPLKITFLRSLNRLLPNTCFNFKFNEDDPLSKFNDSIELNNLKLQNFVKEKIISINESDDYVKNSLSDLFTENYIIYPKFLFYVDSILLCGTINRRRKRSYSLSWNVNLYIWFWLYNNSIISI